jgi:hypothetical protein
MSKDRAVRPGERPGVFEWVGRYLGPIAAVASRIRQYPRRHVETGFWLLALLGLTPALGTDILFPSQWGALAGKTADSTFGVTLGYAHPLCAVSLVVIAIALRQPWRLFAAVPHILVWLAATDLAFGLGRLDIAYAIAAFTVFAIFVILGSVRTPCFIAYLGFLVLWRYVDEPLTWNQVIEFAVIAIVASLVYEAFRQNWPLVKDLGKADSLTMLWRTFSLWSPTIVLICAGLWLSNRMTDGAEEVMYQTGAVDRYCLFAEAGGGTDVYIECPNPERILSRESLRELNYETGTRCVVWDEWQTDIKTGPMPDAFDCPERFRDTDEPHPEGIGMTKEPIPEWQLSQAPFFTSVDQTVARRFAVARWQRADVSGDLRRRLQRAEMSSRDQARIVFGVVPRTTGLRRSECALLDAGCAILNLVKSALNSAYARKRRETETAFIDLVEEKASDANATGTGILDIADSEIEKSLIDAQSDTATAITRLYKASGLLSLILTLWIVVIGIKSFLYVFSRVIFDKETEIHVDLLEHEAEAKEGRVEHQQEITIPGDYPYDIYYKADYQPLGPAPRFSIPQWTASALSRLRFGAWSMSKVTMPVASDRGLTFNSIEAEYLVDWHLEDGEEVVFGYRNFVAMNENIELRTVVSLRVATLLMGRIVFHTARCRGGNGRLILRTRGKPATADQVRQSIPASRLIAWNRYARFSVDSHLTRRDIFLNGFNLRRSDAVGDKPQGILIVEADARGGRFMVGTLRFAKNFLLPI